MSLKPLLSEYWDFDFFDQSFSNEKLGALSRYKTKDGFIDCLRSFFSFDDFKRMKFFYYVNSVICEKNTIKNPYQLNGKDISILLILLENGGVCTHSDVFDDSGLSNGGVNTVYANFNKKLDDDTKDVTHLVWKLKFDRGGVFYMINPLVYNKVFGDSDVE